MLIGKVPAKMYQLFDHVNASRQHVRRKRLNSVWRSN